MQTYYRWRKKYGGLMPQSRPEAAGGGERRLKQALSQISRWTKPCCRTVVKEMYGPPRRCKALGTARRTTVCVNVSGLSRVSCCCSQAMMRSTRAVPTKLVRALEPAFSDRAYGTLIRLSRHHSSNLAICYLVDLSRRRGRFVRRGFPAD